MAFELANGRREGFVSWSAPLASARRVVHASKVAALWLATTNRYQIFRCLGVSRGRVAGFTGRKGSAARRRVAGSPSGLILGSGAEGKEDAASLRALKSAAKGKLAVESGSMSTLL